MNETLKKSIKEALAVIIFSSYPVSFLYQVNFDRLLLKQTMLPYLIVAVTALLFFSVLKGISLLNIRIKNVYLIVPFLSILLFTYGNIFSLLSNQIFIGPFVRNRYLIPLYLILSVFLIYAIHSIKNKNAIRLLFCFIVLLNLIPFVDILFSTLNKRNIYLKQDKVFPQYQKISSDRDPDIYFIILDMYPSNNVLKKYWDYDNSKFINELKKHGFKIFDESKSNYPRTYLALNSVLNMKYIHQQNGVKLDYLTKDYLDKTLQKNHASVYLKKRGYNYYVFDGGIFSEPLNKNPQDFYLKPDPKTSVINFQTTPDNDFLLLFINNSIVFPFADKIEFISSNIYRKRIKYVLRKLPILANQPDKKFVIAHIMSPHSPYIFGEKGEEVFVDENSPLRKKAFLKQLKFINKQILSVINLTIKSKNTRDKIIIIQGDHGTREISPNGKFLLDEDWAQAYYGNLNAIFSSNKTKTSSWTYVSPVNTFRQIFNSEFGENFTILPDKKYYTDFNFPLIFYPLTETHK
jgi:hypothetical protein